MRAEIDRTNFLSVVDFGDIGAMSGRVKKFARDLPTKRALRAAFRTVEDDFSCVDDEFSVDDIEFDPLRGGMHVSKIPFGGEQTAIGACLLAFRGTESTNQAAL